MRLDLARRDGYPYADFLENAQSYSDSRIFWLSAFAETVGTAAARWRPWMDDRFGDGHPIFSMIEAKHSRGIMLQQVVGTDDPFWFKCWVSQTETDEGVSFPYLGIETFISVPSRTLFQTAVEKWVNELTPYRDMIGIAEHIRMHAFEDYPNPPFLER